MSVRPEDQPTRYLAGCAGKDRYPSKAAALATMNFAKHGDIWGSERRGDWADLTPYLCVFTEPNEEAHWHLGHS